MHMTQNRLKYSKCIETSPMQFSNQKYFHSKLLFHILTSVRLYFCCHCCLFRLLCRCHRVISKIQFQCQKEFCWIGLIAYAESIRCITSDRSAFLIYLPIDCIAFHSNDIIRRHLHRYKVSCLIFIEWQFNYK